MKIKNKDDYFKLSKINQKLKFLCHHISYIIEITLTFDESQVCFF